MGVNVSELEGYLTNTDVDLGARINVFTKVGLLPADFVRLGEALIEGASAEEKIRYTEQLATLCRLVDGRKAHLNTAG